MEPKTITCDGTDYEGLHCGATALLQGIDYYHEALLDADASVYRHVLRETRVRMICPKCGPRLQVEKAVA